MGGDELDRLLGQGDFGEEAARRLIAEARTEAWAEAKRVLAERMARALLERSAELLESAGAEPERARAERSREPAAHERPSGAAEPTPERPVRLAEPTGEGAPEGREPPKERAPEAGEPAGEPAREAGQGVYVYCVVDRAREALPDGLVGVDGSRSVSVIRHAGLGAVASRVPLSEFGEEALRENLNDLDWLETAARAHEEVLDRVFAGGPIVPLRLCTIYASEERVREMLEEERERLAEALARLRGAAEWGVKAFADRRRLEDAARRESSEAAALSRELEGKPEGAAYLARRKLERLLADESHRISQQCAEESHARLSEQARDAVVNPPQSRELSGRDDEMVLNGAYLVDDDRAEALRALVDELGRRFGELGVSFELTGPWPPYNFVHRGTERLASA